MATPRKSRRPADRTSAPSLGKLRGILHPRVQRVGPEHFGIVCFDPAKNRSKFRLADCYGRVLIPPTWVEHNRPALDAAVAQVRQAFADHQLRDGVVAIERTGRYHRLVQRAFQAAAFETRIIHPFVTSKFLASISTVLSSPTIFRGVGPADQANRRNRSLLPNQGMAVG
jgi:transposase